MRTPAARWIISISPQVLVLLLVVSSPALAAGRKPPPHPESVPAETPQDRHTIGLSSGDCGLGESDRVWTVNYLEPPGDVYYTLLRTEDCDVCGPGVSVDVLDAALALEFQVACAPRVTVSVVAAVGDTCPAPDPATVYCGPVEMDLVSPRSGVIEFRVPVPPCEFTGKAFLKIEFHELPPECASAAQRPRLVTSASCEPCAAYNHYPGHEDDLCGLLFPGRPVMFVGTTGCGVVPVLKASWGKLRTLYRD